MKNGHPPITAGSALVYVVLVWISAAALLDSGCASSLPRKPGAHRQSGVLSKPPSEAASATPAPSADDRSASGAVVSRHPQLRHIEDLIEAGDTAGAQARADAVSPLDLSVEEQMWLILLRAQIYLGAGNADSALKSLAAIMPEYLDDPHKIQLLQSRAFAFSLTGNPLESAKTRIALQDLLPDPEQRRENQAAILESLTVIADPQLDRELRSAPPALAGWLELAKTLKLKDQAGFGERLAGWRLKYPGHPANSAYLDSLPAEPPTAAAGSGALTAIALFLPGSGPYAEAGNAVQAGFKAALNAYGEKFGKPEIKVYDTATKDAAELYNQALAAGARVVIGPLEKPGLQRLAASPSLPIPVLALNHVPGIDLSGFYQFGLSPLDDVEAIVRKAWSDGRRSVLLLLPDNAQSQRIAGYFKNGWQELGGAVVDSQSYAVGAGDFSGPIKKLLKIGESEDRFNNLRALIPDLKFTPRPRRDADAVMLYPNSKEARLLNPQLRYYGGTAPLPVYATASVFSGQIDRAADGDLEGIIFCDAPWLLDEGYLGAVSKSALQAAWNRYTGPYLRLFAMGIDAYLLAIHLYAQDFSRYGGATGELTAEADNRIKRNLACAKFAGGRPVITDPVEASDDSGEARPSAPLPYYP